MRPSVVRETLELEERHWWFVARRRILRRLLTELVPPGRDNLVVDVGCGGGATAAALTDGYQCVGVDPSAEMIESARRRHPGVRFVHGTVEDAFPPSADPAADACLLADVLEHVEDDRALLAEVVDVCRPGGTCLITVPADPRLWGPHDEAHGHHRRYDRSAMARLLSRLPVEPLLISHFNARLYPLVRMVRRVEALVGRAPGPEGTDLLMPPEVLNRILTRVFAGEAEVLRRALVEPGREGYRRGASLLAAVRRVER